MRRRFDREYDSSESFSPWQTYSDLFCGLLLVFVLLFFFAIYQYIDARERNDADTVALQQELKDEQETILSLYKAELESQQMDYQEKEDELESQRTAIAVMSTSLDARVEELEKKQTQINEQETQLEDQQAQLKEQQQQLLDQQSLLGAQQLRLEEQEATLQQQEATLQQQEITLQEQQALLDSQAVQIEQIVGVRGQLISALNQELSANQIQIQADSTTGAIIFESSILFATDSNELSDEGKAFFRSFMPVYLEVLLQPEFAEYIAEIIIEGHTDNTGLYLHNLELSQQRAWSVAEYFLNDKCDFLTKDMVSSLKALVTVNGCADKSPIYRTDGTIDAESSRRVEIKFRLKDQEMIQNMDAILNN